VSSDRTLKIFNVSSDEWMKLFQRQRNFYVRKPENFLGPGKMCTLHTTGLMRRSRIFTFPKHVTEKGVVILKEVLQISFKSILWLTMQHLVLKKRAEDIYGWINVIVKNDWSFNDVNDE